MLRFSLIMSMCFLYIVEAFAPSVYIGLVFNIVATAVFLLFLPLLEWNGRIFTLALFTAGGIIHYTVGDTGFDLVQGITQNMPLLSILILAPLLSVPLRREGIIDSVILYLNELKSNPRKTFYGISTFMLTLAPILNMGALRIVHGFVESIHLPSKLLSRSYYVGFTPAVIWSPFFASVGIVLFYLDITYLSYVAVGVIFAVIQMTVGIVLFRPKIVEETAAAEEKNVMVSHAKGDKKDMYLLFGFVLGLVVLLIVMEQVFQKTMLLLVSIICFLVPAAWVILRKRKSIVKEEIILYKNKLHSQKMEICLFLSAGLFGNAVSHTPVKELLEMSIKWSATQSIGVLFLFIILLVTFMAFLGVHQIIVTPLILTSLDFTDMPNVAVASVAFMCIFTWMLSSAISPLNAMNIIISQCVQRNGVTVAFKWNGVYFLSITAIAFVYVYILNWI
ncbi:hypothetical protein HP456_12425 [Bacillus haikouensis]|jgi:hypothetical protein|uniref:hypothetical protein n=1 Tax=Bacillus haikouensis TaxID=1510468 RepID=UPI001551DB57|nr:hypothetical protein [Bacillus haikouensis]NQD66725.1 hypothetical protein [Bacillus haikouensis]